MVTLLGVCMCVCVCVCEMELFTVYMCVSMSALGVHCFPLFYFCVLECLFVGKTAHMHVPASERGGSKHSLLVLVQSGECSRGAELSAGSQQQRPQLQINIILIDRNIDPHAQIVQQPNGRASLPEPAERDPGPFYGT